MDRSCAGRGQALANGDPVDVRGSFDTLSALVEGGMKRKALTSDVVRSVACSRKRTEVLYSDGTELCSLEEWLEKGCFARA